LRHYRRNRQGSGKAKKILFRIGFVIIAALVIIVTTVLLGLYLRSMVDNAGGLEKETDYLGQEISREQLDSAPLSYHSETVFGCGIDISDYQTKEELEKKIIDLSAYYDTLNITVTDQNGNFTYTSPALCELLRIPFAENDNSHTILKSAITSSKALGMRVCVIMASSEFGKDSSAFIDATVASEMVSLGADEILFIPKLASSDYINYNLATKIRSYFNELRDAAKGSYPLGIILPASAYKTVSNTKQLQIIASAVSFLAIDFSPEIEDHPATIYTSVLESIASLSESFKTYNMRIILSGTDEATLGAAYTAAIHSSINNIAFTSSVIPTSLTYTSNNQSADDEDATEVVTNSPADNTNPYAQLPNKEDETESGESRPWY